MLITTASDATGTRIAFLEQVTVQNADEVRADLRSAIAASTDAVTLDLSALDKVDSTFFQLLIALNASLRGAGRSLRVVSLDRDHPVRRGAALLGIAIDQYLDEIEVEE